MMRTGSRSAAGVLLCLLLATTQKGWAVQEPAAAPRSVASAGAASPTPTISAEIPLRRDPPADNLSGGRMAFAVWSFVALAALVWAVVRLRRRGQQRPGKPPLPGWAGTLTRLLGRSPAHGLMVMGATRLTARHSVHVVAWNHTEYLLACSEQGVTLLAQRAPQSGISAQEPQTP